MDKLNSEIQRRWLHLFGALQTGEDVPPAYWLHTEGLMMAAALVGLAEPEELMASMAGQYQLVFARSLAQDFGEDWREFYPFPQIPAYGRRAPVWPSTPDAT